MCDTHCGDVEDILTPQGFRSDWAEVKAMNATMRAVEYFILTVGFDKMKLIGLSLGFGVLEVERVA